MNYRGALSLRPEHMMRKSRKLISLLLVQLYCTTPLVQASTIDNNALIKSGRRRLGVNVGGNVYYDINRNGVRDDPDEEPGVPDAAVEIRSCADDELVVDGARTNARGDFNVDLDDPGCYYARFEVDSAADARRRAFAFAEGSDVDPVSGRTAGAELEEGREKFWQVGIVVPEEGAGPAASVGPTVVRRGMVHAAAMLSASNYLPSPPVRNLHGRHLLLRRLEQENHQFCPDCIWSGSIVCEAHANFLSDNKGDLTLEEAREEISDVCSSENGLPPDDADLPAIPLEFFCGQCQYSSMNFDCDARVAYIEASYYLSTEKARKELMEAGECIDPSYVAPDDEEPEPDIEQLCPAKHSLMSQSLILRTSYGNIFSITTSESSASEIASHNGTGVETITIRTLSLRMANIMPEHLTRFEVWLFTGSGDGIVLNENDLDDDPSNDNSVAPSKAGYQSSRANLTDWVLLSEGMESELLPDKEFFDHNGHFFNVGTGSTIGPLGHLDEYENMEEVTLAARELNDGIMRDDGGMNAPTPEGETTETYFYKIPEEKFTPLKLPKHNGRLTLFVTLNRVGLHYGYAAKQEFDRVDVTNHDHIDQTPSLDELGQNANLQIRVGEGVIFYPWMEEDFFYQTRRFLGKIWYDAKVPCEYAPVVEVPEVPGGPEPGPGINGTNGTQLPSFSPSQVQTSVPSESQSGPNPVTYAPVVEVPEEPELSINSTNSTNGTYVPREPSLQSEPPSGLNEVPEEPEAGINSTNATHVPSSSPSQQVTSVWSELPSGSNISTESTDLPTNTSTDSPAVSPVKIPTSSPTVVNLFADVTNASCFGGNALRRFVVFSNLIAVASILLD